jgi:hypothetical protein
MQNPFSNRYKHIYVVGVDDIDRKKELFYRVSKLALERNMLPELDLAYIDHYVESLLEQTECTNIYTNDNGEEAVFCSAFFTERDPHMHGKGLYLNLLLSTGKAPELVKELVHSLVVFAKSNACQWIAIHHRTAPRTYRCQYRLLNKDKGVSEWVHSLET